MMSTSTTASPLQSSTAVGAVPYAQAAATSIVYPFSALLRGIYAVLAFTTLVIAHPFVVLSPFPLLFYLLAPLFLVIQLALDAFIYTPLRLVSYLADALYPIYVLVAVACITGGILGLSGRLIVQWGLGTTPLASTASEAASRRRKLRELDVITFCVILEVAASPLPPIISVPPILDLSTDISRHLPQPKRPPTCYPPFIPQTHKSPPVPSTSPTASLASAMRSEDIRIALCYAVYTSEIAWVNRYRRRWHRLTCMTMVWEVCMGGVLEVAGSEGACDEQGFGRQSELSLFAEWVVFNSASCLVVVVVVVVPNSRGSMDACQCTSLRRVALRPRPLASHLHVFQRANPGETKSRADMLRARSGIKSGV
ncbi:hypothetical protein C8F01DRAFT_1234055 [Mycena amicta]|nr:hypothetical protein C8F01DRAFT_1234055 [Mycena amicta]